MPRNTNAGNVARKVIEQLKEGKRPNITEAAISVGYSRSTARARQKRITEQKEYKRVIKPFIDEVDELIALSIGIVKDKYKKATFRDGIEGLDKLKKLKALETGTSTDNIAIKVGWESEKEAQ